MVQMVQAESRWSVPSGIPSVFDRMKSLCEKPFILLFRKLVMAGPSHLGKDGRTLWQCHNDAEIKQEG